MRLHPLPPEARCPYCRKGGLAFVRQRGRRGDLYRCTAATPCEGHALHHRRDRGACGVSAEAACGDLLSWTECPGQGAGGEWGDDGRVPQASRSAATTIPPATTRKGA
jgi:hypothetical protein